MDPCPLFVLSIKYKTDYLCEEEANHEADQNTREALAKFGSKFPIGVSCISIYLVASGKDLSPFSSLTGRRAKSP